MRVMKIDEYCDIHGITKSELCRKKGITTPQNLYVAIKVNGLMITSEGMLCAPSKRQEHLVYDGVLYLKSNMGKNK